MSDTNQNQLTAYCVVLTYDNGTFWLVHTSVRVPGMHEGCKPQAAGESLENHMAHVLFLQTKVNDSMTFYDSSSGPPRSSGCSRFPVRAKRGTRKHLVLDIDQASMCLKSMSQLLTGEFDAGNSHLRNGDLFRQRLPASLAQVLPGGREIRECPTLAAPGSGNVTSVSRVLAVLVLRGYRNTYRAFYHAIDPLQPSIVHQPTRILLDL
jgi:hypothetical protein